jgi:ABC-type transport system involved in cytochrome c biogenesis permease subunit
VVSTQLGSQGVTQLVPHSRSNPIAWAFLLPGAFGLGGLAWAARRRPWLNRFSLFSLVALVTTLGATACAPRYNYYNHGPPPNPATPAGTYTVTVTAQSTNGVTAIENFATIAVTVTP